MARTDVTPPERTEKGSDERGFRASPFFVIRTPLLPFATLCEWAEPQGAGAEGEGTKAADEQLLIERLRRMCARADVAEAIFLGSPVTAEQMKRWLAQTGSVDVELERTVAKYVQRAAGRATPFGLFAGGSVGRIRQALNLRVGGRGEYLRNSRVDNEFLFAVADSLAARPGVRKRLKFKPNSSLYKLAGRWRYIQSVREGTSRKFNLVAVEADASLDAAFAEAPTALTIDEWVDRFAAVNREGGVEPAEASAFVDELVGRQLLVSELSPIVTGLDPLDEIVTQLHGIVPDDQVVADLVKFRVELQALDREGIGVGTERYRGIAKRAAALGVSPDLSRLVQVDLRKPAPEASLSYDVVDEIARAVCVLQRMSAPSTAEAALKRFRESFGARYERRWVPLVEVLDEESGIGFDPSGDAAAENAPLLAGIPWVATSDETSGTWSGRDGVLLNLLAETWRQGLHQLELSERDVVSLSSASVLPLPGAFHVLAVVAADGGSVDDWQVMVAGGGGPSGATLYGRFCHADPELTAHVRQHLLAEEALRTDALFAEVVHLPDGRLGNIVSRPVLRGAEIVYLGRSGADSDRQIPLTDLLVTVAGDRVVLWSKRFNREIIPRLTTAHNFRSGTGIYKFLCSLQGQGQAGAFAWRWGQLESLRFLPRVTYGRIVFARARWRVSQKELRAWSNGDRSMRMGEVQRWRSQSTVPRFVSLVDGDNELPVDLDNLISVDAFVQACKKQAVVVVVEMWPTPDRLAAQGPEGAFVHELLVPFVRDSTEAVSPAPHVRDRGDKRKLYPGEEWLYVKLYGGTGTIDRVLSEIVAPAVVECQESEAIDQWFFVRYADPEWHLRLRLRGRPEALLTTVWPCIKERAAGAIKDGSVWRVQIDTYHREVERYGGERHMRLSEEVFWRDSEAALRMMPSLAGDEGMESRALVCALGWDRLMSDFGLSISEKAALTRGQREALAKRARWTKPVDRGLGDQFRRRRGEWEAALGGVANPGPVEAALEAFAVRSSHLAPVIKSMDASETASRAASPSAELLSSFLHMQANRVLRSSHNVQEFVIFDFMSRVYESRIARTRSKRI